MGPDRSLQVVFTDFPFHAFRTIIKKDNVQIGNSSRFSLPQPINSYQQGGRCSRPIESPGIQYAHLVFAFERTFGIFMPSVQIRIETVGRMTALRRILSGKPASAQFALCDQRKASASADSKTHLSKKRLRIPLVLLLTSCIPLQGSLKKATQGRLYFIRVKPAAR